MQLLHTTPTASTFRVRVLAAEVEAFNTGWPGYPRLPRVAITFEYDRRNGDLVDITARRSLPDGELLLALSHDAERFGIERLKLDLPWITNR